MDPSRLLDPAAWLRRQQAFDLVAAMQDLAGDPCIGLHLAELNDWAYLGRWSRDIVSATTLGEAIRRAITNLPLLETGSTLELLDDGERACLRFTYLGPYEAPPDQFLMADLYSVSRILRLAQAEVPVSARIELARPGRPCIDEIARLLGPGTEFGASANELIFPRAALGLALAEDARSRFMPGGSPGHESMDSGRLVVAALDGRLEFEPVTLESLAKQIGMNARTLQRRLGLWGVTFEEVLDDYRKRRAVRLLAGADLTVTDVAFRLGYSDSAHFTRAFRRWFDASPRQFRAHAPASAGPAALPTQF